MKTKSEFSIIAFHFHLLQWELKWELGSQKEPLDFYIHCKIRHVVELWPYVSGQCQHVMSDCSNRNQLGFNRSDITNYAVVEMFQISWSKPWIAAAEASSPFICSMKWEWIYETVCIDVCVCAVRLKDAVICECVCVY